MPTVNLQQVADVAQVSRTSASEILQGGARTKRYHPDTIQRVMEVADRLGYQKNAAARLLRKQASTLVGIAVQTEVLRRPLVNSVVVAAERAVEKAGYQPVLVDPAQMIPSRVQTPFPSPDLLAGILSADLAMEEIVPDFYITLQSRLPIVALYDAGKDRVDCVTTDRAASVELSVAHLVGLGHKRIAFTRPPAYEANSQAKIAGWERCIKKYAIDPNPLYRIEVPPATSGYATGQAIAERLLQQNPRPTAVICTGDEMAVGVVHYLSWKQVKIPSEMSVTAFDGTTLTEETRPALSSSVQPVEDLGSVATSRLLDLIEAHKSGSTLPIERQLLAPRFISRESTGSVPA